MKRRLLTIHQRNAILKCFCLLLSVCLLLGAFSAVPYIVSALPKLSGYGIGKHLYGTDAVAKAEPSYAFDSGKFDTMVQQTPDDGEYEPETPIPSPTPGEDDLSVTASNLCWYELNDKAQLNILNRTKYKVDLNDYIKREFPISRLVQGDDPLVLIVHTHGSESYLPAGYDFYSPDETFRSLDESQTVVHIGEVLAERLNELGIKTVHDKTMYDTTDFNKAYSYSRRGITQALEKYPSIQFVIDLHRDSVFDSAGNNIKPLTEINGEKCAQIMLVVGTDEGGAQHPDWRQNLTFATYLQQSLNDLYPTLARPVNLRSAAFNQALRKGSVLIEVGSCGNTVSEAALAARLFADAYAGVLLSHMEGTA